MMQMEHKQLSFCGIRLDALTVPDLMERIDCARTSETRLLILNHNLHSLFLYQTDNAFRDAYKDADCVYIDGIPVVWLARAAGLSVTGKQRITFLDSFEAILQVACEKGWRVFYLGSTEKSLEEGLAKIRFTHPDIVIAGHHGYLGEDFEDAPNAISEINKFKPDVLFVGMGMPRQERFLAQHFRDINVTAALTSGATLDYITGNAYKPPSWAGPLGLYGLLRLVSEPRRLWRRYLIEPLVLLWHIGSQVVEQRRRTVSSIRRS